MSYILEEYKVLHHPTDIKLKVEIIADQYYRAPHEEHDGHGVVMDFDYDPTDVEALIERQRWDEDEQSSPEAMEEVARAGLFKLLGYGSGRGSKRYYDVWETMKIAVTQWGVSPDDKQAIYERVMRDYEYIDSWYSDDWCWSYIEVTMLNADGEELTQYTQSRGGFEYGLYANEENIADNVNEMVREALAEYNDDLNNRPTGQLELIPVWEGLKGEVTRLP